MLNICKFFYKFLKLPNSKLSWKGKEKRLNRGAGYGLEIPVICMLNGHEKAIEWIKSKIQEGIKLEQCMKCRCLKQNKNKKEKVCNFCSCALIREKNREKSTPRE